MPGRLWVFPIVAALMISCGCAKQPAEEQIKRDLVGKTLSHFSGKKLWTFNDVSEFGDFKIIDKRVKKEVLEYTIHATLTSPNDNTKHSTDFVVLYKDADGKWEIFHLYAKKFTGQEQAEKPPK